MRFMIRLVLLGFLLSGIVACSNPSAEKKCKNDDGCLAAQTCVKEAGKDEGVCKAKSSCDTPCKSKDDCKNNQTCEAGCCKSPSTCKTKCQAKSDCTNGQDCQKGCCTNVGGTCSKADDCPEKQECIGASGTGVCQACGQTCGTNLDCSTGTGIQCYRGCCRRPPCKSNSGCDSTSSKKYCDTKSGQCVACLVNKDCNATRTVCNPKTFTCKKVECTDSADCPSQKPVCSTTSYKCEEKPVCRVDSDCTDPQLNRCDPKGKGTCKRGNCQACTADDECGTSDDFCVKSSQGLKDGAKCLIGCKKNSDCPTGFDCEEKVGEKYIVGKGISVCFPRIQYCKNPCQANKCKPKTEFCNLEKGGICELRPAPCKPCTSKDDCNEPGNTGNTCLTLGTSKFCGKACTTKEDCPKDQKSSGGATRDFACVGGQCTALDSCK